MCKSSWFMLGLGLGIKADILKRVESERTGNSVENCLFDLLVFWLNSGNASVKNLVDVLIEVNMCVLADKIQKKYAGMYGLYIIGDKIILVNSHITIYLLQLVHS